MNNHTQTQQKPQSILLNNEYMMNCPDGFHIMTEEERGKMNQFGDGMWIGLSDLERHMIVSIGWKQVSPLALMLLSTGESGTKKSIPQS